MKIVHVCCGVVEMHEGQASSRLWVKFAVLLGVASIAVFAAYYAWTSHTSESQNERRALAEARTLSAEMDASWDYIDSMQDRINYTNGVYDFKGVYCSVAGKNIAKRFTDSTDYSIRYVRDNPRSGTDIPDEFEASALRSFADGTQEYYAMSRVDGKMTFRYVAPLEIKANCLECHGSPAGEKDVTGFVKEGMQMGDLAGAVSICLPMDAIEKETSSDLASTIVFFCVLMAVLTVVLGWGLRRWVTHPIMSENVELRREAESQSNFLTIVTHELKTPLSAILAFSDLLKKPNRPEAEKREIASEIEGNAHELLSMVNNVLDTAKFEEGSLVLHADDVDVRDVVGAVRSVAMPLAERSGVRFSASVARTAPVVKADREMLRRVCMNLVSNALQHTGDGGDVALNVSYGGGVLAIVVSDTGTGIDPARLEAIFDRFSTGRDAARSSEGGTGLGLFIVKKYAEAAGGCVSVESELGVGSTFTVAIPAVSAEGESAQ